MMDSLTFPANFRLLQLWFSVQLCYYIYAQLSTKKNIFDFVFTLLRGRHLPEIFLICHFESAAGWCGNPFSRRISAYFLP